MTRLSHVRPRALRAGLAVGSSLLLAGGGTVAVPALSSAATPHKTATSSQVDAVLLRGDVAIDAYTGVIYSGAPSLAYRKGAAAKLRIRLGAAEASLGRLKLSRSAAGARKTLLAGARRIDTALARLRSETSLAAFDAALTSSLTPALKQALAAENQLRRRVGLPPTTKDRWFAGSAHGPIVYRDDLSRHHGNINWLMGSNVGYQNGGLAISAASGGAGMTGPTTPYRFDGKHVSVEVDALVTAGQPFYGVMCPQPSGASTALIGVLGSSGNWAIGTLGGEAGGFQLTGGTSSLVKSGQANHIRVDCAQFSSGLATAKLYVNGKFVGESSAPLDLGAVSEAGLTVISTGSPASGVFKNWTVEKLRS